MLTLALFTILIGLFLIKLFMRFQHEWKLRIFPSPKGHWLLGNAKDFKSIKDILPTFQRYHSENKDGKVRFRIGWKPSKVCISNYEAVEKLLTCNKNLQKGPDYRFLKNFLGEGILTSSGAKWHARRKLVTPAFHFQILEEMFDVFTKNSDIFCNLLENECKKNSSNVAELINQFTLDVIAETAMGIEVNAQLNANNKFASSVKNIFNAVAVRMNNPFLAFDFIYRFTNTYKQEMEGLNYLHSVGRELIEKRRTVFLKKMEQQQQEDIFDDDGYGLNKKKKRALLDLLLNAQMNDPNISDRDIIDEVNTFMAAGQDTTATTLSNAFYNLAQNPEAQEKLFEEQMHIFEEDKLKTITSKHLNEMKYTEMVIKETLRLNTAVPLFGRTLTEDLKINEKETLPKGTITVVFSTSLHTNPEYYPEPEKFVPERFAAENKSQRKPYAFIPFSAGARNCLGQKFAMTEMKCLLSTVIRRYKIHAVPGFQPDFSYNLVVKSNNGIHVRLEKR